LQVKDLDGNEYNLQISKKRNRTRERSKLHQQAKEVIRSLFPRLGLVEEVPIKIRKGLTLYLDIFVPSISLVIEVHGRQHYEFIPHFHEHRHRFGRAKLNDELKKEWCYVNQIRYVELAYNEPNEWETKLRSAIR
jgi:hypothetical protein